MHLLSLNLVRIACAVAFLVSPAWSRAVRNGHGKAPCKHEKPGHGGYEHGGHGGHGGHGYPGGNGGDDGHVDYLKRNFDTISHIYNLTVFPNQIPIITGGVSGVPPGLFSQDVVGRVNPVGQFDGFQDSIEYFFALAPIPQGNAASAAITSYQITEFTSGCADIAASVVYLFCSVVNPGAPNDGQELVPLKQIAFWKFDEDGAVLKYDAWIANLNRWVELTTGGQITNPAFQMQTILEVCAVTQMRCTGANQQWATIDECVADLSQRPFGNYDEAMGDNVVCRTIHLVLTQVRPDMHCPHVGPTGGGKCVDFTDPAKALFYNDESLYGDPLGTTFMCNK